MTSAINPLDKIDLVVADAVEHDDPYIVFNEIRKLIDAEEFVGMAKAKFIFMLHTTWDKFSISLSQSLEDTAYECLNWSRHTVDRYLDMWRYRDELPNGLKERPVSQISPITKTLAQGYELDDEQWDRLGNTTNQAEVYAVLREIKGSEPRKGSLQVYLYDDGSVVAWHNEVRYDVGYLDVNNGAEAVQKAISRIIAGGKLIKK